MNPWKYIAVVCAALILPSCGGDSTSESAVTSVTASETALAVGEDSTVSVAFQVSSSSGTADNVVVIVHIDAPLKFVQGSTRFDISSNADREPDEAAVCNDGSQVLVYNLGGIFVDNSVNGFTARQFSFKVIGSAPAAAAFVRAQASSEIDFGADCSVIPSDADVEISIGNS